MTLGAIEKVASGIPDRLAIFPMPADILSRMLRSIFRIGIDRSLRAFEVCDWNQNVIFSQHGERRKRAMGLLSAGRNKIVRLELRSLLFNERKNIGNENALCIPRPFGKPAHVSRRLKMNAFDRGNPFLS
jgi:hypothetical protein